MGHQVNFYLDPVDTASLEQALRTLGPLHVLHSRSPGPQPKILDSVTLEENGKPWLFFCLVRPEDMAAVVTAPVPAQGYWTIDELRSPVVELTRCFFDGATLRRGRLYYVDGYYNANGVWEEKSEAFRTWAKRALSRVRRLLKRYDADYIGPGADSWLSSGGGRLVL